MHYVIILDKINYTEYRVDQISNLVQNTIYFPETAVTSRTCEASLLSHISLLHDEIDT